MQRGPKPQLPAVKIENGTYQACRDANRVEIVAPDALPQQPDWLTAAGEEVWIDEVGRASAMKLLSEADTTMFANYCNLQGCIIMAWRALARGETAAKGPIGTSLLVISIALDAITRSPSCQPYLNPFRLRNGRTK